MKHKLFLTIASLFVVTAIAISGCQGPAPVSPPAPDTAKPAAPAPAPPAAPAPANDMKPAAPAETAPGATAPAPAAPAATAPAAAAPAGKMTFEITPETTIVWAASVTGIGTRKGGWTDFTGKIEVDGSYETAKVSAEVQMISAFSDAQEITTKMKGDEHFFQPGKFPTSKFVSTGIKKTDAGYDVTGDLTIRDKTKSVTFPITDFKVEGKKLTCKSKLTLKRSEFGIEYASAVGDYVIHDDCELQLDVVAEAK